MYKIKLADGTELDNLELNGNNYISQDIIEDSVFDNNLDVVEISDGETTQIYTDMKLMSNRVDNGRSWFILGEKSKQEKLMEQLNSRIEQYELLFNILLGGN